MWFVLCLPIYHKLKKVEQFSSLDEMYLMTESRSGWMIIRYALEETHLKKTWLRWPLKFLSPLNSVLWSLPSNLMVVMLIFEGQESLLYTFFTLSWNYSFCEIGSSDNWMGNQSVWENIPRRLRASSSGRTCPHSI